MTHDPKKTGAENRRQKIGVDFDEHFLSLSYDIAECVRRQFLSPDADCSIRGRFKEAPMG